MTRAVKQMIGKWARQFPERLNEYDDEGDFHAFFELILTNEKLRHYMLRYMPRIPDGKWEFKPNGEYGIDFALVDSAGKKHLLIDLERWNKWEDDWPENYKYISFLGRKDHFLEEPEPFLMVFLERNRNKVLIVDKETIKKYTTREVNFSNWKVADNVKKIKLSDGHIFGTNITDNEREKFAKDSTPNLEGFL
jgi:hypothetical protein